jgi:pilus assembly protein FimV
MAFFLIGKSPDNDLTLLSSAPFDSRQDAMATLSKLTAEAGFDRWDDEVFVVDLESGVPVLLVRPQATTQATPPEAEIVEPAEGGADAWEADLPAAPPASPVATSTVASEEEPVAEETSLEPAAVALNDTDEELRAAILRTTQQMSAEGIVPPESAGLKPAEAEQTPQGEDQPEVAPEATTEPETPEATAETAEAPESAPAAWPWAPPGQPASSEDELPDAAEVYSALAEPVVETQPPADEEPAPAYDSLVSPITGAREPMSATAPSAADSDSDFILDLDAIEPSPAEEGPAAEEPTAEQAPEPRPATLTEDSTGEEASEKAAGEAESPEASSDEPAETPAAPFSTPLTEYTCEDCVYVVTCPNRDQRQPKDCGSFQWK